MLSELTIRLAARVRTLGVFASWSGVVASRGGDRVPDRDLNSYRVNANASNNVIDPDILLMVDIDPQIFWMDTRIGRENFFCQILNIPF